MMWGADGWGWISGALVMVGFWGLIVLVVWAVIRGTSRPEPKERRRDALDVLEERFARGEIDEQEFEARRRTLERAG